MSNTKPPKMTEMSWPFRVLAVLIVIQAGMVIATLGKIIGAILFK